MHLIMVPHTERFATSSTDSVLSENGRTYDVYWYGLSTGTVKAYRWNGYGVRTDVQRKFYYDTYRKPLTKL